MAKNEAPVSIKSANRKRGWRPLALLAVLALAGCSPGGDDKPTEARVRLFPDRSAVPAPQQKGPREIPVLVDCVRNPKALGGIAAMEDSTDPSRVGETYIIGTYDSSAPVAPGGQKAVINGVSVAYEGNHVYSVRPTNEPNTDPADVKFIDSAGPEELATFAIDGASISVETAHMPAGQGVPAGAALVATIVCTNAVVRS